ncbi:MAG: hypothetical protein EP312_05600 [Gammaproteobacteria bacterium]|nr:MAG: hypothetical protein EP312_05600 [Gammaproteobacteria bacterium]
MNILGLIGYGYNPGAALVVNGQLVAHAEEERFTRLKGSHFVFPRKSVAWMLQDNGLSMDDIDVIAWGWDQDLYRFQMPLFYARNFVRHSLFRGHGGSSIANVISQHWLEQWPSVIREKIKLELLSSGIPGRIPPIKFVSHHLSHAASAFYLSGFPESNILVVDGSGERYCTSLYHADGEGIHELEHIEMPNSLGWFYAAMTEYLGFIPYRDEGKVMGLAPYGECDNAILESLSQVICIEEEGYQVNPEYTLLGKHNSGKHFSDALIGLLGPARRYGAELSQRHKNIAFATQYCLEKAILAVLKRINSLHPGDHLCVAGGVALNCKMNGVLRKQSGIKGFFVQPSSTDAGSALGAALWYARQQGERLGETLVHTYYGSGYSDETIETILKNNGLSYSRPENIAATVGLALSQDKLVGVFQGRAEFGARALGHRSILANPLKKDARDRVNARVKFREAWRPFCPSVLNEERDRYIEEACFAPFMATAFQLKAEYRELLASIVHEDGSIRPQTVDRDAHAFMWQCIDAFRQHTGHGIVLNTSFNVRGQPIVESPGDAIGCFFSSGLDALAIGPFWLEKGTH